MMGDVDTVLTHFMLVVIDKALNLHVCPMKCLSECSVNNSYLYVHNEFV